MQLPVINEDVKTYRKLSHWKSLLIGFHESMNAISICNHMYPSMRFPKCNFHLMLPTLQQSVLSAQQPRWSDTISKGYNQKNKQRKADIGITVIVLWIKKIQERCYISCTQDIEPRATDVGAILIGHCGENQEVRSTTYTHNTIVIAACSESTKTTHCNFSY